ncbi:MAG: hypothetical protein WBY53_10380 [Acidobacteriaceae bacterium]
MTHDSSNTRITRITQIGLLVALFVFLTQIPAAFAQQQYVGRYDLYTGFSDLYTPALNKINQKGFHLQAGINNNRWLSTGFDYSVQTGNTSLVPSFASPAIIAGITQLYELYALSEGTEGLPPTYAVDVPLSATTQTFTAGSQLNYRHFSKMTLFIRPSLAAFRLAATAHPRPDTPDLIVVGALEEGNVLQPNGTITDWTGAYGVGGGADFAINKHVGIRVQLDAAWNHPFNYVTANGGWSYRYSVGPSFHFGRNILTPKKK